MLARGVSAILTCSKIMHRHDLMSSTPKTTIDPNTLALHETVQVATHYGHTLWTTKVNNGNLYQWDNGTPVFVPRSTEFKFAAREIKKRDALDEFDEIEQGHGI